MMVSLYITQGCRYYSYINRPKISDREYLQNKQARLDGGYCQALIIIGFELFVFFSVVLYPSIYSFN